MSVIYIRLPININAISQPPFWGEPMGILPAGRLPFGVSLLASPSALRPRDAIFLFGYLLSFAQHHYSIPWSDTYYELPCYYAKIYFILYVHYDNVDVAHEMESHDEVV
jgi:hypothetical protein